jgi:RHS repeat-associated protein
MTDAATTLSYMQQRYYDPIAMRFVSVDPVAASTTDGGNFNRYWYANNNPYKFTDPDGREAGFAHQPDGGMRHFCTDNAPSSAVGSAAMDFVPVVGDIKGAVEAFNEPTLTNIAAAVISVVPLVGDLAGKGIKAADNVATANRAESRAKGVPDSQIGPSGKPKIHSVDHGGRRGEAREAARRDGGTSGSTVNHTSPKEGKDHYHGVTQDGEKSRVHHEYNR